MKRLRQIHLYLGCAFAPLIIFFCVSGLWQTFRLHWGGSRAMAFLSTLHTSHELKTGGTLSSTAMQYLVAAMSLCLVATVILGIVMAVRFGRGRNAAICLVAGVVVPLLLVLVAGRF